MSALNWPGTANHSPDNIYIHFPGHDTLMFIDVVNAGWVPIYNVNLSEDVIGYMGAPAIALSSLAAVDIEVFTYTMQSLRLDSRLGISRTVSGPTHDLWDIDVDVPLWRSVEVVGVSGSGKTSLAIGALYAEGMQRFLESLSTYSRPRLTQAQRPGQCPVPLHRLQQPQVPLSSRTSTRPTS